MDTKSQPLPSKEQNNIHYPLDTSGSMNTILIDLTQIPKQKTGVGIYAVNLIQHIAEFDNKHQYFILIQNDEDSFEHIQKANINFIKTYSKVFRILPFRFFFEQVVIPFILIFRKIDLIHSIHYSFPLVTFGRKRVVTIHDLTFFKFPELHTFLKRYYFKACIHLAAKMTDQIICSSKSTEMDLISLTGAQKDKIKVINLAKPDRDSSLFTDRNTGAVKNKFKIQEEYLLFVGMIEPRKNLDKLVLAFDKLRKESGGYQLVIAGPRGWLYDSLFHLIDSLECKNNILFTGYIDDDEKAILMKNARIFVYPSLYEGFGLPVLEAMSLGIPTVTSNISSMPEIAGDAAVLINPESVDELYEGIKKLLDDDRLYNELKTKSMLRARQFSWEKTARETISVYEDMLNSDD